MIWNSEISLPMIRLKGKNRKRVGLDPITKKFFRIDNPKQPLLELTVEDKARVVSEFRTIFKREPDKDEIDDLYREEFLSLFGRRANKLEVGLMNNNKGGRSM